ncbi:MAG: ABC transporter ATP-binding protein [Ruminococcaceae bacterium]|nr:ABC transporter ATP-binding protein [Oscillospiraceae bacterium]
MIEIQNLTKRFDTTTALNHISLTVKDGAILGLVGSNGAGKSTLLRILAGVYEADSGTALFDGVSSFDNTLLKGQIIFVPDYPYFSSADTLQSLARRNRLLYPGWSDASYEHYKSLFALSETEKIVKMSKGMQRQAAIILGLSANPKYIFFDEIFDGLDPVMRELVKKILIAFVSDCDACVIIASHNLRELEDVCDSICLLHSGGVLADSDVDNLKLNLTKVQLILEDEALIESVKAQLDIIKINQKGKVYELTIRGSREEIVTYLNSLNPVFMELISLSLEEVFINEMEVSGYEIHSILADS